MIKIPRSYRRWRNLIGLAILVVVVYTVSTLRTPQPKGTPIKEIKEPKLEIKITPVDKKLPKLNIDALDKSLEEEEYGEFAHQLNSLKHSKGDITHEYALLNEKAYKDLPVLYNARQIGHSTKRGISADYKWRFPLKSLYKLEKQTKDFPKFQIEKIPAQLDRLISVKKLFINNWNQYFYYSRKYDSFKPLTLSGVNDYIGWSQTLIDSLDTLFIMGFPEEFEMAVSHIETIDFTAASTENIPIFETNIRILGGLISAFDISQDYRLLEKAIVVADILARSFDTPSHDPVLYYNLEIQDRVKIPSTTNYLSEIGSLSLEFTRLSIITGEMSYMTYVMELMDRLLDGQTSSFIENLIPDQLDLSGCESFVKAEEVTNIPKNSEKMILIDQEDELVYCIKSDKIKGANPQNQDFSLEGKSDSFYEYILKLYILLNGNLDPKYKTFFENAKNQIKKFLVFKPKMSNQDLVFLNKITVNRHEDQYEIIRHDKISHLSCFAGGLFTMSSRVFQDSSDLTLGQDLTKSCNFISEMMELFPEWIQVDSCDNDNCKFDESERIKEIGQSSGKVKNSETFKDYTIQDNKKTYKVRSPKEIPFSKYNQKNKVWKTESAANQPLEFNDMDPRILLRPELIESLFINFRITGEEKYRTWAWTYFENIVRLTSTDVTIGKNTETVNCPIKDITDKNNYQMMDELESWWFAETLKYFYLIFQDSKVLSLDEWVFNTQGHPLKKEKYWLHKD